MFCFCYFCKKIVFFILGVPHNDAFYVQIGPKKQFLRRFINIFQNCWIGAHVININWIP